MNENPYQSPFVQQSVAVTLPVWQRVVSTALLTVGLVLAVIDLFYISLTVWWTLCVDWRGTEFHPAIMVPPVVILSLLTAAFLLGGVWIRRPRPRRSASAEKPCEIDEPA